MMTGKIAIVSGGATLIGRKIAEAFVTAGAYVTIADINEKAGKSFEKGKEQATKFIKTDITSDKDIDDCIEQTLSTRGGVDYLINVACTYMDNGMASSRDEWLTALNTNLVGAAIFAQKVVPHMQARGCGAIVNFGSVGGKVAQSGRLLYSVSKAGLIGMTRNQALLLCEKGIRVNSVSPGWTWSNVIRDFSKNDRKKADEVAAPLHINGRLVDTEEVANAVLFLCSDAASGITGTDIAVDGGYCAIGPEQKTDQASKLAT